MKVETSSNNASNYPKSTKATDNVYSKCANVNSDCTENDYGYNVTHTVDEGPLRQLKTTDLWFFVWLCGFPVRGWIYWTWWEKCWYKWHIRKHVRYMTLYKTIIILNVRESKRLLYMNDRLILTNTMHLLEWLHGTVCTNVYFQHVFYILCSKSKNIYFSWYDTIIL